MTLVLLVVAATAVAAIVAALCWHLAGAVPSTVGTARGAGAALRRRSGHGATLPPGSIRLPRPGSP